MVVAARGSETSENQLRCAGDSVVASLRRTRPAVLGTKTIPGMDAPRRSGGSISPDGTLQEKRLAIAAAIGCALVGLTLRYLGGSRRGRLGVSLLLLLLLLLLSGMRHTVTLLELSVLMLNGRRLCSAALFMRRRVRAHT